MGCWLRPPITSKAVSPLCLPQPRPRPKRGGEPLASLAPRVVSGVLLGYVVGCQDSSAGDSTLGRNWAL